MLAKKHAEESLDGQKSDPVMNLKNVRRSESGCIVIVLQWQATKGAVQVVVSS